MSKKKRVFGSAKGKIHMSEDFDDFCIWTLKTSSDDTWYTTCKKIVFLRLSEGMIKDGYKFCPYCGEEIKSE